MTDIVEIERLRAEVLRLSRQGSEDAHSIRTAEDEIERLQQERDEAVLLWQEWQAAAEQAEPGRQWPRRRVAGACRPHHRVPWFPHSAAPAMSRHLMFAVGFFALTLLLVWVLADMPT